MKRFGMTQDKLAVIGN